MKLLSKLDSFRREIIIVLIIKLILIVSIKYTFFNNPISKNLTDEDIDRVFLGTPKSKEPIT